MAEPPKLIPMAVIGAAHGLKGEVRVRSFAADPMALGDYGPLQTETGRALEIAALRPAKDDVLVTRFKGVNDRASAEALNGEALFLERERLPPVEDEEEFYYADLIGLGVRDAEGREIGRVTAVENFGGGDLLELDLEGKKGVLIPFSLAAVPEVRIRDGYLVIDAVAAGLAETGGEDEAV